MIEEVLYQYNTEVFDLDGVNLALLILRVVVGLTLAAHGMNKIFGGGKIAGTARWFGSLGVQPARLNAWMAALTEIGAGVLIAVGLLTPIAAGGMVAVMLVAGVLAHRKNGFFIFNANGGGIEYVMVIAAVGLALGAAGAGEWSLDNAFGIDLAGITPGFVITAVLGVGGALLQLLLFWRPSKAA